MRTSEAERAQRRLCLRTTTERPVEQALVLADRHIVDAGDAGAHQPVLVELPVLVAVAALPVAVRALPFIGEAHGDAVVAKAPQFLGQPVLALALPLARQECFDGRAALQEFAAIAPAAVDRIGLRDPGRI